MTAELLAATNTYPDGTRASAPGWHAVKRAGIWWGGDFNGIRLGEDWDVPKYAVISLPGAPLPDASEEAALVFAKRRELAAEEVSAPCDAKVIQPDLNDPFGWFCVRELGHPDEEGDGGHRWI